MKPHRKRIYAARPITAFDKFNTPLSVAVKAFILHCFPKSEIEDPGQPHHQKTYDEWVKKTAENLHIHNAMQYFYTVVLPELDECVAMPFLDGQIGLGVAGETQKFLLWGRPVWFMEPIQNLKPEDVAAFIKDPTSGLFRMRHFTNEEIALIRSEVSDNSHKINLPDTKFVIQHQETRLRTWIVYNKIPRPYEEAHLVKMSQDGKMPEGFYPAEPPNPDMLKPKLSQ